jgi:hypothetical protein
MHAMQVNSGTANERSSVAFQLPPSPTMVFAIRIEHALDVAVQRTHDADPRESGRRVSQFQGCTKHRRKSVGLDKAARGRLKISVDAERQKRDESPGNRYPENSQRD